MPRQARKESDTGYYHVMTHGINNEYIFESNYYKNLIIKIIKDKVPADKSFKIIAYCIMDNHLHMAVQSDKPHLIETMKKINISYAMTYNRIEKRVGALFRERYKTEIITDDVYLLGLIRYIHNNPIKAGIEDSPEDYQWSSISEYISGKIDMIDKNMRDEIINRFTNIEEFKQFHEIEDLNEYLEMSSEIEENIERQANKIIEDYFEEKEIYDKKQLDDKDELIVRLLKETKLSYRRIAQIMETSASMVYRAGKGIRDKDNDNE